MEKKILNRSGEYISTNINPEIYNNSSEINGYAVVINNFDFCDQLKYLSGGEKDSKRLQDTFRGLRFDVKIHENKKKDEMLSIIKEYGDKNHSDYNMFVCVLSSHGSDESIYGSDGKPVMLVDLVRSIINCQSLEGKPKLFFIDVCRTLTSNSKFVELRKNADNMFCFSTLEGKVARMLDSGQYRGSVFCKVLCDTLRKYGDEKAWHDILQHLKSCINNAPYGQSIETLDSLKKILWFVPKNHAENYTWTVAIDFGTSMSGFAYSTCQEFNNSPLMIFHKQCWNHEAKNRDTMKTASCLLLDSNKKLVAFGFDAQAEFARQQLEDKQSHHYYFHNFKMAIYNQQKSLIGLEIMDIQEKPLQVKEVFVASIGAIKQEVLRTLTAQYRSNVEEKKIRWVLTVPAIWPDDAKLFMRECAQEAKLPWEQLLIALEPEAASIYCQFLAITKESNLSDGFKVTDIGTKYLILDVGGGTTDITVHEKEDNGKLRELKKVSGRNIGSSYINEKIMEMFVNIFGKKIMNKLKTEKPSVYLDLCWEIEAIKKTVMPGTSKEVRIAISYPAFNTLSMQERNQTIDEVITYHNNSENAMNVQLKDDKLVIQTKHLLKHFRCLIDLIIEETKVAIESIDVSLIILVGGFADCRLLTEKMEECFPNKRVISPEDCNLAVLKGAVLYGHKPSVIDPRITKFTYGIEVLSRFDDEKHDTSRRQKDGWGNWCCKNAFDLIICQNENVPLGKVIKKKYCTTIPYQKNVCLNVFTSNIDNPLYTDDKSCRKIGTLRVGIPNPSKSERFVDVNYIFGDTELKVEATEQNFKGHKEQIFFLG